MATQYCSSYADCSNVMGSFQCTCKSGFAGDGKTCQGTCRLVPSFRHSDENAIINKKRSFNLHVCFVFLFVYEKLLPPQIFFNFAESFMVIS